MAEADKLKDQNLERARMKIVAENEKQIDDMKASLNEAMIKEEKKLDQGRKSEKNSYQLLSLLWAETTTVRSFSHQDQDLDICHI